jgi:long-chain acyl-CoA synthetase
VWLSGVTLMQGYWRQPEATAQALVDGSFRTGDVGYLDDAGFLYIVDRIKDVINRSGEKIAAAEIESCLSECASIQESAVVAVHDACTGEAVVAIVVPRPGFSLDEDQVKAHVASRLAAYKVPARVIVRTEALPRNPTGKLVKRRLREEHALL